MQEVLEELCRVFIDDKLFELDAIDLILKIIITIRRSLHAIYPKLTMRKFETIQSGDFFHNKEPR